jgi:hypothetical protein
MIVCSLYDEENKDTTWIEVLKKMHVMMKEKKFDQIPQLSSSRVKDLNNKAQLIHPGGTGKTKALLMGINVSPNRMSDTANILCM